MSAANLTVSAIGKIARVRPLPALRLEVTFDDEDTVLVDLDPIIAAHPALSALREEAVFAQARVSNLGWGVAWPGEIDFGAPQLRRWADEQAGVVMPVALFKDWMVRHRLTLDRAAEALGLSRRMVAYYASGEKPIPKTVWLATEGFEARASPQAVELRNLETQVQRQGAWVARKTGMTLGQWLLTANVARNEKSGRLLFALKRKAGSKHQQRS